MAQLLVVSGANGAVEWTFDLLQDDALGGPAVADVDGDDTLLEIIVGGGSFTLGDAADHTGRVIVLEPNAADLSVTNLEVLGDLVKGNPQTVRATVANPGTRDAVNAAVRLLANGAPVGPDATATVPAGGSVLVDFPWTPSGSGPHTLLARADPADALRELVETNNERSLAVTVLKRFDLSIVPADVTFSPAQPILGDTVTVTATVRNVGEAATPASSILRFEEAGIPLSEDRTIPVLNPGASSEASVSFTVAEERTHHFVITADPANALVEEREDNNVAMKDLEILVVRPDLSIVPADVTFSPPQPILGDTVTVTATVRNVGDLATPGSSVVRFEEAGIPLSEDRTVPQLNPGGSAQASITFTVAEERTHHFVVTADPDDAIDETSEANNVAAKDLAVLVVRPDLSIVAADISFSHANPPVGETVTISATVRNLGNQNAPASKARIIENGTAIGPDLDVPAIPQGGSANVQQSFTIVEEREHAFTVVVDALNAITESNEANNQATKTLPVRTTAADLVAASLAASPGIADPGQAVGLSATFRNDGNRSLSGFTVSFFDGATLLGTAPGPALAEGASATVPFTWTSTEPRGVHTLRAVGAPVGLEQRSDNNEAAVGVVVGTLAVAVVMDKATYGVDEPVTGQAAVTFTGTNLGVPGVPVVVDVYYRVVAGLTAEVHRARLTGETDADGQFAFVVPKTLLGGVNVCVNNMCPINQGDPLGLGKNVPGDYRVRAEADRLGFKFDANGFYSVAA